MEKPNNYDSYKKIPYREWPSECKAYKNYLRRMKAHPEWEGLSDEEIQNIKYKQQVANAINMRNKYNERLSHMSDEERADEYKKRGNGFNNASAEEKSKIRSRLQNISKSFWDGLDDKQRKQFQDYRSSFISEEQKQIRNQRFTEASKRYMASLSAEQITDLINMMNARRSEKRKLNPEWAKQQDTLLRNHNEKFFASMSDAEKSEFYKNAGSLSGAIEKEKWDNPEYALNHTKILQSIGKKGAAAIREKWFTDPVFRENMSQQLKQMRSDFMVNLSPQERAKKLGRNKLNQRFERQFNESILSNEYKYIPEYLFQIGNDCKTWDYLITDIHDNPVMVVDLDGKFFHADCNDYNGLHSREEYDEKRGQFIPDGLKCHIITELNFINSFEEMMHKLILNYDEYIQLLFDEYRKINFPYPEYTNDALRKSFDQLIHLNPDNKYLQNLSVRNREGDWLINHFHHSIYHAKCKGSISPYDAWHNDKLLMKCIKNRTLYQSLLNPNKILQGFNICKLATKVSVFSAGRAKLIIHKYLNEFDTIFDPFSGFSGRMLGTMSLSKQYIGQDISPIHIAESIKISEFIKFNHTNFPDVKEPVLHTKNILDSYGIYDCLFTCPPYGDKEQWQDEKPSTRSCDDWIDICLSHFKCKRYVFVVDNTIKYKDYIVDEIINKSHFGSNSEKVIVIERT